MPNAAQCQLRSVAIHQRLDRSNCPPELPQKISQKCASLSSFTVEYSISFSYEGRRIFFCSRFTRCPSLLPQLLHDSYLGSSNLLSGCNDRVTCSTCHALPVGLTSPRKPHIL